MQLANIITTCNVEAIIFSGSHPEIRFSKSKPNNVVIFNVNMSVKVMLEAEARRKLNPRMVVGQRGARYQRGVGADGNYPNAKCVRK